MHILLLLIVVLVLIGYAFGPTAARVLAQLLIIVPLVVVVALVVKWGVMDPTGRWHYLMHDSAPIPHVTQLQRVPLPNPKPSCADVSQSAAELAVCEKLDAEKGG